MITIRNTQLYKELKKASSENGDLWTALFNQNYTLKDAEIPYFAGQLDHIEVKKKGIYFIETSCNGKDNSFVIRPALKLKAIFKDDAVRCELCEVEIWDGVNCDCNIDGADHEGLKEAYEKL